jgi:hypothetical protein
MGRILSKDKTGVTGREKENNGNFLMLPLCAFASSSAS